VALFIHGVFLSADLWHAQLEALGDLRRCIAVDLLAHGASPLPRSDELTIGEQADMMLSFIEALDQEQVDLVANDSGGAIAQIVAARAPHLVRTLTLTNCDVHDNWPPTAFQPIQDMARAGLLADGLMTAAADPSVARAALTDALEAPDAITDSFLRSVFGPFADSARARSVESWVAGMEPSPTVAIHDDLARFVAPTLVAWGTADTYFHRSWARWLSDTIPGVVRVVEIPGAKLLWPLEQPGVLTAILQDLWTNTEPRYGVSTSLPNNYEPRSSPVSYGGSWRSRPTINPE
jgi:pimeloyl-ACP methyl ester carboxylesterase